ncbi:MAG: hypothetical protein JWN86_16 [Planctomycetota bacterium]|nr:hypothetical protein [Planctomycetota bacterium]
MPAHPAGIGSARESFRVPLAGELPAAPESRGQHRAGLMSRGQFVPDSFVASIQADRCPGSENLIPWEELGPLLREEFGEL